MAVLAGCILGLLAIAPRAVAALSMQPVGDFDHPIFVTAPPGDPRLFVIERPGYIQVLHDGTQSLFLDIHTLVDDSGERGLLSMAFDPNYASNGLFYVFFTDNGTAGASAGDNHVDEFQVSSDPNAADPTSRRRVLTIVRNTTASNHNAGQLQFGKDGLLYISAGDAANGANAQSLANLNGKILRIDPHGAGQGAHGIPADNPFTGSPAPETWSLGLRNPFRFSFDHATGDIVIGDVGSSQFEEIDYAPLSVGLGRGANYGWPNCEGFTGNCSGFTSPVFAYADTPPCNAVLGGYVYRGSRAPEVEGRYLYTDLCHNQLRSLQLGTPLASDDRSEGVALPDTPYSFGEDANCDLYIAAGSGSVQRIVGSAATAAPACRAAAPNPVKKKKKCKKRRHKKKHRAAESKKKHKKKRCKKRKKKHQVAI